MSTDLNVLDVFSVNFRKCPSGSNAMIVRIGNDIDLDVFDVFSTNFQKLSFESNRVRICSENTVIILQVF